MERLPAHVHLTPTASPTAMPASPRPAHVGRAVDLIPAVVAYLMWGVLPLYFHALTRVGPLEVLAYRIVGSVVLLVVLVALLGRWQETLLPLRTPRGRLTMALTTLLISGNWLLFIWAVQSARVLDASLGYFINPLVSVLLGVLFLGETLSRRQLAAVALAAAGVMVLVVHAGALPWVSLVLAVTFGSYGLLRKQAHVDPVGGLLIETALLAPLAIAYIAVLAQSGHGHFGTGTGDTALLAAGGGITATPLILFAMGVRRLRLSTMGVLQYIAPSLQFALAVFAFGETFTKAHALAFACIWASLVIYTYDALVKLRR